MNADAILLLATIVVHLLGVITLHLAVGLATLLPVAATVGGLLVATRREGPSPRLPIRFSTDVAYREGRQCSNGVGGSISSPPARCALPLDHYGECEA